MAVQLVFSVVFQGDTWLIHRWHAKHYAFGQVRPSGEEVWSGIATSMFTALGGLYDEMGKIADQIDEGKLLPLGPFLDENGKVIPQ